MKYTVYGYLTISAVATVEADSGEEAKEKALALDTPGLCHQCSNAGSEAEGSWTLNGFDPVPDDAVQHVEADE